MTDSRARRDPKQVALARLGSLAQAGLQQMPKRGRRPSQQQPVPAGEDQPCASEPFVPPTAAAAIPLATNPGSVSDALAVIRTEVAGCTRCEELATTRTQTVFGVGNPQARLCFLGEAPGADEDQQGEPFVGKAGQLLTRIIEACTLTRSDVYILNVLKCRPPGNRTPLPDEVSNCSGYLERQLALIKPEFICCLGAVAAQSLLASQVSIGRLRGTFHDYQGIQVLCTYHPAYLLRNPSAKKDVWEDMKILMAAMGIALPQSK